MLTSNTQYSSTSRRGGFTLMEVNVALLLVAVGLMGLLSLFPVGLRQSDQAASDTAQAAFADGVLNAMHANASTVTNWNDWNSPDFTNTLILAGVTVPGTDDKGASPAVITLIPPGNAAVGHPIKDYIASDRYIAYTLNADHETNSPVWRAWIQVTDLKHMDIRNSPVYATSFYFMGM